MPRAKHPKVDAQHPDAGGDTAVDEREPLESAPIEAADLTAANAEIARLRAELASRPTRVAPTSLPGRELHTDDVREPEIAAKVFPDEGLPDRGDTQVLVPKTHMDKDYIAELAFMEEPVTIRIEPSQDENAAWTIDCWVQGKGAEIFNDVTKRWMELNCLPVGRVVTTKRKYVEVLARSKTMKCRTPDHGDGKNIDKNEVTRHNSRATVFSVIKDTDKGAAWLTRVLNESF